MGISVYRDRIMGSELVGGLDFERGMYSRFEYDKDYLVQAQMNGELGISERLPLSSESYGDSDIAPFFQGLLPEGDVLSGLASMFQTARGDYLGLIERLGCESIGALTFISDLAEEGDYVARYEPVTHDVVEGIGTNPIRYATRIAGETRLSLAGAQSKVAWLLPEGIDPEDAEIEDWYIPMGTAPSSHIVKIAREGERDLALNEMACSLLSASCGIETARVSLIPDLPGAIAVERYDRQWVDSGHGRRLLRLHQEDLCQALGFIPAFKYQPNGVDADYVMYATDLLRETVANPAVGVLEFAKRLVFNYVVGNADAHLKNSSLLYDEPWKTRCLAPMYDITCIPLSGYSTRMPFDIGEHREIGDIDEQDILSIALDAGVSVDAFDDIVGEVIAGFESPVTEGVDSALQQMLEMVIENSESRIKVLKSFLRG